MNTRIKKILEIFVSICFVLSLSINVYLRKNLIKIEQQRKVVDVLDGDTFILGNHQRFRLLNVNAPELGYCGAEQAKERLRQLVVGKSISYDESVVDSYGRLVASVYIGNELINETILKEGWGVFEGRKTFRSEDLKNAAHKAKAEKLGIYGPECYQNENLSNPKCVIKGNHDWNSDRQIYHFPGCSGYNQVLVEKFRGDEWFCTEKEAQKAGYQKSANCFNKTFIPR